MATQTREILFSEVGSRKDLELGTEPRKIGRMLIGSDKGKH